MTDILCKWLNDEVKLSKVVEIESFAEDFASGYYLGEILNKFQLQDDFSSFSRGKTADAKLNNFTRLEPTLHLLQIPFDTNIAYDVIMLRHGVATRLLYQLYVALLRKTKSNLTGAAMQTMRAPAPVKLEHIESGLYKERLKTLLSRESDLTLKQVSSTFQSKKSENERKALEERYKEMRKYDAIKQEQRHAELEKSRVMKHKQTELLAKIQAATVHIPKPPSTKTLKALNQRRDLRRKKEAENASNEIVNFEKNLKKLVAPTSSKQEKSSGGTPQEEMGESSSEYLQRIKDRLEEDATAREERAKRRRKVLVDQMKAHQVQEEALRQEQVVQRLMRQSQQERRIAVQLMQARREKDTIRKNRIFQQKQIEERRLKDFQDALDKEAELCKQAKQDYEMNVQHESELHQQIMAERAMDRYKKHYNACYDSLSLIIDFSCKIAEYRELTSKKVPEKLVREWKEIILSGNLLYKSEQESKFMEVKMKNEDILDDQDFSEYKNMVGEWQPAEGVKPENNNILGHILQRMFTIVKPTPPPSPPPSFPEFPLRCAIIGKMFSGKTSLLSELTQRHRVVRLSIDEILTASVDAFLSGEIVTYTKEIIAPSASGTEIVIKPATPHVMDTPMDGFDGGDEEKRDAEKDFSEGETPQLSPRATLGKKAIEYLQKGEAVPDQILVEVIVEGIRGVPQGTGWVLDGFPTTQNQAVLLEKVLTGCDVGIEAAPSKRKQSRKSNLAVDPKPAAEQSPIKSGLDVVILLDVSDELVLKRATGRTATEAGEQFHEEFKPAPPGSQTGVGKTSKVFSVQDPSFDKEQVQIRISSFHDNWPKIERLYNEISNVRVVDGDSDQQDVYSNFEFTLFEALDKIQNKDQESVPVVPSEESKKSEVPKLPSVVLSDKSESANRPDSGASKKSKRSSKSPDSKSAKSSARGRKKDEKGGKDKSRSRSGSGKSGKGKKKSRSPTPEPVVEAPPPTPPGPPEPQPGDPTWEYVNEELPLPVAHSCVPYWTNNEDNYVRMTKHIFRQIRSDRESIIRYLYETRQDFKAHLSRPDHKQTFVSSWQLDFNEMPDDLRQDDETKAELHQRLDDMRERLWDICDTRKEDVEVERTNLLQEGWIEDHLGVLTNHYLGLMQCEIDRFQDTVQILKDYYTGMQKKIPGESPVVGNLARLPLVELDLSGQEVTANQSSLTVGSDSPQISAQPSQSDTKKSPKKSEGDTEADGGILESTSRTKIPLVQRGAPISSTNEEGGKGKKGKAPQQGSDSPVQDDNLEEKTIIEAFNFANNVVTTAIQTCESEREREEEEERRAKEEEEKLKAAAVPADKKGGGKKGGGKSAKGGKKGGKKSKSPTPTPPTPTLNEEVNEEEAKKRKIIGKMKDEYFAALHLEEAGVKSRLELIKTRANLTLGNLRSQSEEMFADMLDWLGSRYLREMAAIDNLSSLARQHIEEGTKLEFRLELNQDEFEVNTELKLVKTPTPPPRPPPVEISQPDNFTVVQLTNLLQQFYEVAPNGIIANKAFVELLADMAVLTYGADMLPESWMNISYLQLVELCTILSPDSEYIDWRRFLLVCTQPWPPVTNEELLRVRASFVEIDVAGNGWITYDQYQQVELWFSEQDDERPSTPNDPEDPFPYERLRNLRMFFFSLFADQEQMPPRLDYINMMMYFSMDKDHIAGFFRALSVACGNPMPRLVKRQTDSIVESSVQKIDVEEFNPVIISLPQQIELEDEPRSCCDVKAWWLVLHHGSSRLGDSHRFSVSEDPEEKYSIDQLRAAYDDLEAEDESSLSVQVVIKHVMLQDAVQSSRRHQFPDVQSIFTRHVLQSLENMEISSENFA